MGKLSFALGCLAVLTTLNGLRPNRSLLFALPLFVSAWLTIELAPFWLLVHAAVGTALIANGALDDTWGKVGLLLGVASAIGLIRIIARSRRTVLILRDATAELDIDEAAPTFPRSHVIFPFLVSHRRGIRRQRNLTYARAGGKPLRLDVTYPAGDAVGEPRPGLLQVHGGAWVMGGKRIQGQPLVNHMAANGWVVINANYRLSPRVAFPEHLVDLKRAVAWYRQHAAEYGADPEFLCVTGGSAGGHLAALVGLTGNDPALQPGFEDTDTGVAAAVPFYGVYDFTNRFGTWRPALLRFFIEPIVMKAKLAEAPEAFAAASPLDRCRADAPAFFVIHGDCDTLAPVADARKFVERLRERSEAPVLYAEMQGAQHAFDVFPSYRTARVIEAVERFLSTVHRAHVAGLDPAGIPEAVLEEAVQEDGHEEVRPPSATSP